jgi:hypothetical protein
LRLGRRFRLFHAGLIAGRVHAAMVVMITPLAIFLAQYLDNDSSVSRRDPVVSFIELLPLIHVEFAAGVALTKHFDLKIRC